MQIKNVTIHNFASVVDGSFDVNDYNLIIGENNAGKTNTINAIRVFYGDLSYSQKLHTPEIDTTDDEVWVEIVFELTPDEWKPLDVKYNDGTGFLTVRRYLTQWKSSDGKERNHGHYCKLKTGEFETKSFCSAADVSRGILGQIIYIPAVTKIEDQTKTTGPSPLRDAITKIIDDIVEYSTAYADLTKSFQRFSSDIMSEKTSENLSLQSLQEDMTKNLKHWGVNFRLDIEHISPATIIKDLITPKIEDERNLTQDISQYGAGMQREIIFHLIRLSARYTSKRSEIKNDFIPTMNLYLFEEPEAFLHPTQQLELSKNLNQIADAEYTQVILSSHSSHFVSHESDNLTFIIRLHKDEGSTQYGQIDDKKMANIIKGNQEINKELRKPFPDEKIHDMETIRYFMWLDPDRCSMFFASRVLVVEGATEKVFINYLIKNGVIKTSDEGSIYILDCLGKFNIHRFMQLLGELKIAHAVLIDEDGGRHKDIDKLIRKHQNSYTKSIHTFKDDIESFLYIDIPKYKDKNGNMKTYDGYGKPLNILYQYQKGAYDQTKFNQFVSAIEALLA